MEFAIVKSENILSEFVNINMHCRIDVWEYQIESAISVFVLFCFFFFTCSWGNTRSE